MHSAAANILACAWLAATADSSAFGQALRCDHLEIAAGGNHSAAQLGVVALDVAPSTGPFEDAHLRGAPAPMSTTTLAATES